MAKSPKSQKETATDDPEKENIEDAEIVEDGEPTDVSPETAEEADTEQDETPEASQEADTGDGPTDAGTDEPVENGDASEDTTEEAAPWGTSGESASADDTPADDDTTEADNAAPAAAMPVVTEPEQKRTGGASMAFGGMVLGGLVAGLIGFGIAQYASGGWPFATTEPDPMADRLAAQDDEIAALQERLDAQAQDLETLGADTPVEDLGGAVRSDIEALQSRIDELSATVSGFEERITALEKMPTGDSAEAAESAAAAYERELADMRAMLERELENLRAQQEDAAELQANAAQSAQAASARAALSRIMAALDSGQPFDDALFDLTNATGREAPEGLSAVASEGVPTLGALQESFPEMARAALDDSLRAMVEAGEIGRGEAFLRTQLGTRSLEPQEGDDPDAILSRAEFELQNGRIAQALNELEAMPEAAQPAMADWIERARTRLVALDAGSSLADTLNQ